MTGSLSAAPTRRAVRRHAGGATLLLTSTVLWVLLAGCGLPFGGGPAPSTSATPAYSKVLVVMEENKLYSDVIGSADAPYINQLADRFGSATTYQAGYPAQCPSMASYILLTSGSDHGICDDESPAAHPLDGDNLFRQVAAAGAQWRVYAEGMPANCTRDDAGTYLVRHTAAPYYVSEQARCAQWDVPMGSLASGALHDDVSAGQLPAFSLVAPDACDDMHGSDSCDGDLVPAGDTWLSRWLPAVMAGPDYQRGRLVVVVTWDEGSDTDNHIPTLVISPTTNRLQVAQPMTHCSTLRTIEDLLHLSPLGCAAQATPYTSAFTL